MAAPMRVFFWLALAFFYAVGLDVVNKLLVDAQLTMLAQLASFAVFNALVAHLIVKYETQLSTLCALLVGCLGVIGCGVLLWPWFIDMPYWLWAYLIVSLLVFTWAWPFMAKKMANISANK
ncbi:hypothetical protein WCN91_07155 [Pseudoalteromonas sp. YIC-827]|uniref:Uncharacterized protein n=1 Tax=Pseudoalteromonas qingdaonensis TaxID=3131913 RepID=A0ABU9MV91_9GAMM